ncbi:MAG: amino acid adenylation domain-containing protein [Acidobacteria bacterium]|nr:amino acid adenylation domain-containing protein [Acidobacteriota bacterium]
MSLELTGAAKRAAGQCLADLLREWAERDAGAPALLAPGRVPLTYGGLLRQVEETAAALHDRGLGRNDRVATLLPDGPQTAAALVAIAATATCAPLHPGCRPREVEFFLDDLGAGALLVPAGAESAAAALARSRGIAVLELGEGTTAQAGAFTLRGAGRGGRARGGLAGADDVALALHTSGTTSRPKLVPLTQRNICAAAHAIGDAVRLTPTDRCLNVMPLHHIHGLSTVFASLAAGASVVPIAGFSGERFFEWLERFRPTWYSAAPALHQIILAQAALHPELVARCGLRFIRSASSAMPRQLMADLERVFRVPFVEAYGMTEAAPQIASNRLPPSERKPGSVGQAAGPQVAIMDEGGRLLPPGERGEVVIRGPNVTAGYAGDAAANRSAFVDGWLRTGDTGHLDAEGYLFLAGRLKEVINRGGEKISPAEVDEVLSQHPAVARALTFPVPHPVLGESVAAAVVLRGGGAEAAVPRLREFALEHLAPFKVPQQFVVLDEIPEPAGGKARRADLAERLGLAAPGAGRAAKRPDGSAPRAPIEREVAALWAEVLGIDPPGRDDNFFHLGGHSLAATQVVARLRRDYAVDLPIESLFQRPTVAELAELVARRLGVCGPALRPGPRELVPLPLSFAQRRLWFLEQAAPGGAAYNMSASLRLTGGLDRAALERALDEVRRRHETLRTTFHEVGGAPVQVVAAAQPVPLPLIDLATLPPARREPEAQRLATEDAARPFDLSLGPPFRAALLRLAAREHVLLLTMHHIISDGWSTGILHRELAALYAAFADGQPSPLPELPAQYADFAQWERDVLEGGVLRDQLAYWREQLKDLPPPRGIPGDRPRGTSATRRGARHAAAIPPELTRSLRALSLDEGATLFMTLLAALQALLLRTTGQEDLPVGIAIAHRTRPQDEALIGFFANTLVLRTSLAGDPSFRELLRRVRRTALDAYAHQDVPFETVVSELRPERDPTRTPLFQLMFAHQNVPGAARGLQLPDLAIRPFPVATQAAKFDLALYVSESEDGLAATWQYDCDLFDDATIARIAGHYGTLLAGIAAAPDQRLSDLPLLSAAERSQVLVDWNRTAAPGPAGACLHDLVAAQALRIPDAPAVECGAARLSFRELGARATQLARRLRRLGAGPETLVGIALERSADAIVALLGAWKAGAACLPLDPRHPPARLAAILADARAPLLLTRLRLGTTGVVQVDPADGDTARESTDDLDGGAKPESLAYVIYTSGSTGRPKGVMITHANLCAYVGALRSALEITAADRYLHTASFGFSSAMRQLAVPLAAGATVVVATADEVRDPVALLRLARERRVSVLDVVPSHWRSLLDALQALEPAARAALLDNDLRLVLSASEPLPWDVPRAWARLAGRRARLVNMFGHTETTGIVTLYPIPEPAAGDRSPVVPLGRPIANTRVYVLDDALRQVPIGAAGEVHVGGAGVGRGYLHRPDLTAERFIPDPFVAGSRLYRTGDLARFRGDGTLEFLGRADDQVKVRGSRIEPAEIEAALREHPGVRDAAVVAGGDPGRERLAAFFVARGASPPAARELRAFLGRRLPECMVPAAIEAVAALPLTATGKLDRRALARGPVAATPARAPGTHTAPRTGAEQELAAIWQRVLGVDRVGCDDNFFDLGGDSLRSVQVVAEARRAGLQLEIQQVFRHQVLSELAAAATAGASPAAAPDADDVLVTAQSLRSCGREALERAGLAPEGAAIVTEVQLEASLRGQPTHNVESIPRYARRVIAGVINGRPRIAVERETAASALVDGDDGPGQWVGVVAMQTALRKAREAGIAVVGVRRSNHFGAAGHYAWLAAREGFIGLCTTNGPAFLAPTGGLAPRLGNNPLGVGIPAGRSHPIVLDIAMTVAPRGKIGLQLAEGKPLAPGWILDAAGRPSTDLADLAAGLGVPIGGHKGYGLALVLEVLAGVLTGSAFGRDHLRETLRETARPPDFGHFFLALDPALFLPAGEFAARVERLIEQAKTAPRAPGVQEILVPGEMELRAREQNLQRGVPLRRGTYDVLVRYAREAGLTARLVVAGAAPP